VRELLLAGRRRVREVLLARATDGTGARHEPAHEVLGDIAELAAQLRVPVRIVARGKLDASARTESHQGVLARADPLPEAELDELMGAGRGPSPFLVAVDGVTDPGNLGALLRSAECAGVTGVVLPRHRAVHITPAVTKAAAGAVEYLPMAIVGGLPAALARLAERGIWTIGLDASGGALDQIALAAEPVALVVGAEGAGLSRLVRQRCDVVASLPLRGRIGSLNVAAAGAVACYEIALRRSGEGRSGSRP